MPDPPVKASPEDDSYSEDKAQEMLGKRVLVGLTYVNHEGNPIKHKQVHGIVIRVNPGEGVVLELADGSEQRLPPDLRAFHAAEPGPYTLRATGEPVVDPDFVATYTVEKPARA